jgi:hypothetical protein
MLNFRHVSKRFSRFFAGGGAFLFYDEPTHGIQFFPAVFLEALIQGRKWLCGTS